MSIPRALQLIPPYGTSFVQYQPQTGGQTEAWLMYSEDDEELVLNWLRDVLRNHEAMLADRARQLIARQQQQVKAMQEAQEEVTPVIPVTPEPMISKPAPILQVCNFCAIPGNRPRTCCRKGREADLVRS